MKAEEVIMLRMSLGFQSIEEDYSLSMLLLYISIFGGCRVGGLRKVKKIKLKGKDIELLGSVNSF